MRLACLFLSLLRVASAEFKDPPPHEKQITELLFKNYNPSTRPSDDPNKPLNVTLELHIETISDVSDKDGTITISGWIDISWKDCYLCWDPSDYGNTTDIIVPAEKVWRPDVAFNSAVGERFFKTKDVFAEVDHDCTVIFSPGGQSTHTCDLDMTLFPFDRQSCKFVVLTWFSSAKKIRLEVGQFQYDTNRQNEVWSIIGSKSDVQYNGDDNYMAVTFTLHIQRKPLYYILYVIAPLLMLAILNLMVFRLPPDAGEKISLSISVMLAFSIWLIMLNDLTPSSSDTIPILALFITGLMLLSAISTITTVHVVRIHHFNQNYPIPPWAKKLTNCIQKRFFKRNKVEIKENPNEEVAVDWRAVASAVDFTAFVAALSMTVVMIFASIVGFLAA